MTEEEKRQRCCCFTGHRIIPPEDKKAISERLRKTVIDLIEKGYCFFGAGGALGFDTIAAQTILDLKREYPHIKLILVFPCENQTRGWPDSDKRMYEYLKEQADKFTYTSTTYFRGCMQKRNRHLVDNSSACICYLTQSTGGTAGTVKYAKTKGIDVFNVYEKAATDKL